MIPLRDERMGREALLRLLLGAVAAAAGLALSMMAGASLGAALLAAAGGAATSLLWSFSADGRSATPERARPKPEQADLLPTARDLLGAVEEPLLIVRDRRVVAANAAARAVLGQHIEGSDVRLAIRHPAAAERLAGRDAGADEERVTRTELVGLGEQDRRWEMTATLLPDRSRLVRLSDRSEAHAADQMRSDFVANASHELRTPLATLLGFLETLQDDEAAGDRKTRSRFLKIMFGEARRMQHLVEDLMSLSRIEAERFSLPREPVDLLALIAETQGSLAHMFEERGSNLELEARSDSATVAGDRTQLLQLLNNLIGNALKYGRPGTPVTLRLEEAEPDMIRMSVIDQGEGVAAEQIPWLTRRFYRVDAGRSRAVGGTGLGLAIVKHIVGRHRGRLNIRSVVGQGTSVEVYLPRGGDRAEALS